MFNVFIVYKDWMVRQMFGGMKVGDWQNWNEFFFALSSIELSDDVINMGVWKIREAGKIR